MTRLLTRPALLPALLLFAACGGPVPRPALPETGIVDVSCGPQETLSGGTIRLAQRLDQAKIRMIPLRLTGEQARWLLRDGWDPRPRETGGATAAIRARAADASLLVPGMPCPAVADDLAPIVMHVSISPEEGAEPPSVLSVSLASWGEIEDAARLAEKTPEALIEAMPRGAPAGASLTLHSDPPGALALDGIALPLAGASIELDREYRTSIVGSSARSVSYELLVPRAASLRFATAVTGSPFNTGDAAKAASAGAWSFDITLDPKEGEPAGLFRERMPSGEAAADRWSEHVVDLSAWSGRHVTLTFAVEPEGEPPAFALWGDPVVTPAAGDTTGRPNVLLISLDTLRADRVGRRTRGVDLTPHLNRLAGQGVTFTHCRTQAPSTLYGHASMLTGLVPSAHGATTTSSLPDGVPYLPALLADAGWTTVAITDDGLLDGRFGFTRGFDLFRDRFEPIEEKVTAAIERLEGLPQPWFLFFHSLAVHTPYAAPEGLAARLTEGYDGPLAGLPDGVSALTLSRVNNGLIPAEPADVRYLEGLYDAQVALADAALGRLFEELRRDGVWDDTIVAVTADHGEEFDEHGVIAWHSLTCYDEVGRVPLIIKPAVGALPAGDAPRRVDSDVRSIDIAPSILDLAGLPTPEPMMGRSLAAEMRGGGGADRETLCEIEDDHGAALLLDGWKYHMRSEGSVADPRAFRRRVATRGRYGLEELYDLAADPAEQNNLASVDQERALAMREALLERLNAARALGALFMRGAPPPARPRVDEEHTRRLKALGYVQ